MELMDLLKDKEKVIRYVLNISKNASKIEGGILSMRKRGYTDGGMIDKLAEVAAMQTKQIELLSVIALVYMGNISFDRDVALILNKMGRGEEALQQLLENKMK
jgi:hypothetical protein